jgi:large subunit ribosomal protein L1
MKRSKNYKKVSTAVTKAKDLKSYLETVCNNKVYKFDEAVEVKIAITRSNKNPQPYKVSVTYPNQFGQLTKVLVLAEDNDAKAALENGADFAGLDEYVNKITNDNWMDFDVVIATPAVMPKIAKLGRVLGTKGLMPNPKTGTVVTDIVSAVKEFKAGKKNFKEDKSGVMNTVVGKISQGAESNIQNIKDSTPGLMNEINTIHIKTTMGPSMKVGISELTNL